MRDFQKTDHTFRHIDSSHRCFSACAALSDGRKPSGTEPIEKTISERVRYIKAYIRFKSLCPASSHFGHRPK